MGLKLAGFKHVDIYESASKLGEVGAGLNVGPNLYRILKRFAAPQSVRRHEC